MSISKSDQQLIHELHEEIKTLRAENETLRKLVKDLEEKLNTNSRNSSKSPSQDPYRSRKGKKKPSDKKQGAQKGYKGHARSMAPPEDVTEFRNFTIWLEKYWKSLRRKSNDTLFNKLLFMRMKPLGIVREKDNGCG